MKAMIIMEDDTIKKVKNKIIIYLVIVFLSLLLMIFSISQMHFYQAVKVTVEVKTNTADTYQLFYDTGSDFNGAESISVNVLPAGDYQSVVFVLPPVAFMRFRIDPGSISKLIEIKKITLETTKQSLVWTPKEILTEFAPFYDFARMTIVNNTLRLEISGNDPRFFYAQNISKKINLTDEGLKKRYYFLTILLFFVVIVIIRFGGVLPNAPVRSMLSLINRNKYRILFLASLMFFLASISIGWNGTLTDAYGFRQTQTAISVSYLLKGGPWFVYETPVLGPPWSIPFEFPLYQWIVASAVKVSGFPIDQTGRFVSALFFLLALYPIFKILKLLQLSTDNILLVLSLICFSPEYIFWSRTFMIESTALALSIYYLWLVFLYFEKLDSSPKKWHILAGMALFGALAGMVKITTFFAFIVGALLLFFFKFYGQLKEFPGNKKKLFLTDAKFVFFALMIPSAATLLWSSFADAQKALNPLADFIISTALNGWNFGTLASKLSVATWSLFYQRTITDLIGASKLLIVVGYCGLFCDSKYLKIASVSILLFLIPLGTFTNLHFVHGYYAYANGIFLIIALGVILSNLIDSNVPFKKVTGYVLLIIMITCSIVHYYKDFRPAQGATSRYAEIKKDVDAYTSDKDVLMIFGADWSSEMPYYLERRTVMMRGVTFGTPKYSNLKKNLSGYKIGALIFCDHGKKSKPEVDTFLKDFNIYNYIPKNYTNCDAYFSKEY
jgi:hypothetical protein